MERAAEIKKLVSQTILFHQRTFAPSNIPMGIRLKVAIHMLRAAPHENITDNRGT